MKRKILIFAGIMILLAVGWFWFAAREHFRADSEQKAKTSDVGPIAKVRVVPLKQETIMQTITAFGPVVTSSSGVQTVTASFECRIRRVRVTSGQQIETGDILIEVDPSPEALLLLETARTTFSLSEKALANTQERFNLKLATNQELLQAQQTMQEAQLRLFSLEARGLGREGKIKALYSGIITNVDVREGSLVVAGGPLLEISAWNKLEARLGVEPEDLSLVKPGQSVLLEAVSCGGFTPMAAQIRLIGRSVDQATGLVDVFVPLPADGNILLGDYLKARITVASKSALVVPRAALLPEGDH